MYAVYSGHPTAIGGDSVGDRPNLPPEEQGLIHRQPVGESRASVIRNNQP